MRLTIFSVILFAGALQAGPIKYTIAFNTSGPTAFPAPLASDFVSTSAANYNTFFNNAQNFGTTANSPFNLVNYSAGPAANSTQTTGLNENVIITLLSGNTLVGSATQVLHWTFRDVVTLTGGNNHTFSAVAPLPSVTFSFTDGTSLVVQATSVNPASLNNNSGTGPLTANFSFTYATAVPEPATLSLMGASLLLLSFTSRRYRRS
jgi:hypothetical protein